MNNVKLLNMLPAPRNHHCQNMSSGICITAVPNCFFSLSRIDIGASHQTPTNLSKLGCD